MLEKTALSFYRTIVLTSIGFAVGVGLTAYSAAYIVKEDYVKKQKDDGVPDRVITHR